jgi:hypothetical protein
VLADVGLGDVNAEFQEFVTGIGLLLTANRRRE